MVFRFVFKCSPWIAMLSMAAAQEPELNPADLPPIPAVPADQSLATFQLTPGYRIELVAAEPLVEDPVAMAFDENGHLFVAEMRGYSERRDENLGRIRLLKDLDGDGSFETASVYADGLSWPTAVACYDGGVLVADSPKIVFFRDTNDDGQADEERTLYEGFAAGMAEPNVQALVNSLTWSPDGRLYGATAGNGGRISFSPESSQSLDLRGADFSFDPANPDSLRRESGTAQFGLSFDPWGNRYVCSNSRHLIQVVYEQRTGNTSPFYPLSHPLVDIPVDGAAAEVFRISEDEPWRTVRTSWRVSGLVSGIVEGGGRVSGYFTSASGVMIYGGDALGETVVGQAFVGDVGSNLVHRKVIDRSGIIHRAERVPGEEAREFLASTDRWFRPVSFANGPDGALYIADMYREVIEHPLSLPQNIKRHLDLNSGFQRGRIYRVVQKEHKQPTIPALGELNEKALVALLDHPNAWHRETAARLLGTRGLSSEGIRLVREAVESAKHASGKLLAYSILRRFSADPKADVADSLTESDPIVRAWGLRLLNDGIPATALGALANDPDARVRFELALSLSAIDSPERYTAIREIFLNSESDPWLEAAALHAVRNVEEAATLFEDLYAARTTIPDGAARLEPLLVRLAETADSSQIGKVLQPLLMEESDLELLAEALEILKKRKFVLSEMLDGPDLTVRWRKRVLDALENPVAKDSEDFVWLRLASTFLLESDSDLLWQIVRGASSERRRLASAHALLEMNSDGIRKKFLDEWPRLDQPIQQAVLPRVLIHDADALPWLQAMDAGKVNRSLVASHERTHLQRSQNPEVASLAQKLFPAPSGEARKNAIAEFYPAVTMEGHAAAGKGLFEQRCALCHRSEGGGHEVGPDRESFANKGKGLLLVHIIDPNREIAPQFLTAQVTTISGESYAGRLVTHSLERVQLRAPLGVEMHWSSSDVESIDILNMSLMPPGLESDLTLQQMADLLTYVERGTE